MYEHCGWPPRSDVARKNMSIRSMNARSSGRDVVAAGAFVDAIGEPAGVEAVLQLT